MNFCFQNVEWFLITNTRWLKIAAPRWWRGPQGASRGRCYWELWRCWPLHRCKDAVRIIYCWGATSGEYASVPVRNVYYSVFMSSYFSDNFLQDKESCCLGWMPALQAFVDRLDLDTVSPVQSDLTSITWGWLCVKLSFFGIFYSLVLEYTECGITLFLLYPVSFLIRLCNPWRWNVGMSRPLLKSTCKVITQQLSCFHRCTCICQASILIYNYSLDLCVYIWKIVAAEL